MGLKEDCDRFGKDQLLNYVQNLKPQRDIIGRIPFSIGNLSNLVALGIGSNALIGGIPSSICRLGFLQFIGIPNNNLEGRLPNCLGHFSSLQGLYLGQNHFHGPIPTTFTKGCSLQVLSLSSNQLEGTLPQFLASCTYLQVLDVGYNKIQDSFPAWLESLSELRVFSIASNDFYGAIPNSKEESSLTKLSILDVSDNNFTGGLPATYFKNFGDALDMRGNGSVKRQGLPPYIYINSSRNPMAFSFHVSVHIILKGVPMELTRVLETFTLIDMSNNTFHGSIPYSFGNLTMLRQLNLSHNQLSGNIPKSLGLLTLLESLDLSSNQIEGRIPTELGSLTFLSKFNVSYNNLSGEIPQSRGQFWTFENNSYIGNMELCGRPLTEQCEGGSKQPPTPPLVSPQGRSVYDRIFDGMTWQGVLMGYGFGVLVGVVLGLLYL